MISPVPQIQSFELNPTWDFVVAATDGVWDAMSNQEMVTYVKTRLTQLGRKRAVLSNLCEEILDHCCSKTVERYGKNSCDNMTLILVVFDHEGIQRVQQERQQLHDRQEEEGDDEDDEDDDEEEEERSRRPRKPRKAHQHHQHHGGGGGGGGGHQQRQWCGSAGAAAVRRSCHSSSVEQRCALASLERFSSDCDTGSSSAATSSVVSR